MVFGHYLKHRKEAYEKMTHTLTSEIKSPNVHHYQFSPSEDTGVSHIPATLQFGGATH